MRHFSAIILTLMTSFLVNAQNATIEPVHLIAYTAFYDLDYEHPEMVILDINTGSALYSIESACPNSFSPDEQFLTYSPQYSTTRYLLNINTGNLIELTQDAFWAIHWSPNSTYLAYLTYNSVTESERILTIYNIMTAERIELARGTGIWSFRWMGGNLFFSILESDVVQYYFWDGSQIQMLSEISLPETLFPSVIMSPDTQTMIISSLIEEGKVGREFLLVNMLSGEVILLQDSPANQQIIWHPDSTGFAMTIGNYDLVFYNVTTNTQETLVSSDNIINNVKWSANGRYISYNEVYIHDDDNGSHHSIQVYDTVTRLTHEIRNYSDHYASHLSWISDTQLIYNYARFDAPHTLEANNLNDLYLYDVTTNEHIQLTDTPELDEYFQCLLG